MSAKQAVLKGISPDGGLFVMPEIDEIQFDLDQVIKNSYKENALMVLAALLPDYSQDELKSAIERAYAQFAVSEVTPVRDVDGTYVLELFHGPTCAFKDVALTMLPLLMQSALKDTGEKALILTATSGDTGKAAMSGFQDVENTGICVFYPDQKVSAMQYRQMVSQEGKNVEVFGIKGNFDDAQTMVKKLFLDRDLEEKAAKAGVRLSSANSINIGRLIPQIVYYFDAYAQLVRNGVIAAGDPVSFSVPTGNFGDVLAGYYARMMGLPVKRLIVASNANDVLTEFLTTGVYNANRDFVKTISPSMDILVSSNLERLLFFASGKDHKKVAGWMNDLAKTGRFEVDPDTLANIQAVFSAGSADDEATKETIRDVYEKTGYVLDPHSAIAVRFAKDDVPVIALSTASPYKFTVDVLDALNIEENDPWAAIETLEGVSHVKAPEQIATLKDKEELHTRVITPEQMKEEVEACLEALF